MEDRKTRLFKIFEQKKLHSLDGFIEELDYVFTNLDVHGKEFLTKVMTDDRHDLYRLFINEYTLLDDYTTTILLICMKYNPLFINTILSEPVEGNISDSFNYVIEYLIKKNEFRSMELILDYEKYDSLYTLTFDEMVKFAVSDEMRKVIIHAKNKYIEKCISKVGATSLGIATRQNKTNIIIQSSSFLIMFYP